MTGVILEQECKQDVECDNGCINMSVLFDPEFVDPRVFEITTSKCNKDKYIELAKELEEDRDSLYGFLTTAEQQRSTVCAAINELNKDDPENFILPEDFGKSYADCWDLLADNLDASIEFWDK